MSFDIIIPLGTSWSLAFELKDEDTGLALDLTGRSLFAHAFVDGTQLFQFDVNVLDAATGRCALYVAAHDTAGVAAQTAQYSLILSDTVEGSIELFGGQVTTTWASICPTAYPCHVNRGQTFYAIFTLLDPQQRRIDLTGYYGHCRIRNAEEENVVFTPRVEVHQDGWANIAMSILETPQLAAGNYLYDVVIENGVEAIPVAKGNLTVS